MPLPLLYLQDATVAGHKSNFFPTDTATKQTQQEAAKRTPPAPLKGQTPRQKTYLKKLKSGCHDILVVTGPAGTGKSYMAMRTAIDQFVKGEFAKIIITRPTVSSGDEDYGYLPGSLLEKLSPWCIPLIDVAKEHWTPQQVEHMLVKEEIEIAPLGFMRGRTLKNAIVIVDEAQNCTIDQMKMILTRLGEGSRMIVTGDTKQVDLTRWVQGEGETPRVSGLADFIERVEARQNHQRRELPAFLTEGYEPDETQAYKHERIGVVKLGVEDVVRHEVTAEVLELYGEA